jgi:hypothetical protein
VKVSERLRFYRDEVDRSKRWRAEDYDDLWHRMIDLYRGKQYEGASRNDRLVINLAFATKNVISPSVAINNPRFVVNARKPDNAPGAIVVEEVLNYLWRQHRYQDEIRLAVDDWIVVGHGWVKCGYKAVKPPEEKPTGEPGVENQENLSNTGADTGIDDREPVEGNTESEMHVYDDRPYLERVSIFDIFVDPDARHPKEWRWCAQRTWRAIQDVKVDERYDPKARKAVNATSRSRWTGQGDRDARSGDDMPDDGAVTYCEIIEFYDMKRNTVSTFAMTADEEGSKDGTGPGTGRSSFLIKPTPIPYPFCPLKMIRNYEVPDHFYPMGELEQIESLQLELNETRNQMLNHRKRFARKWIYARDMFDEDGVRALESDVDNTMIPINGDNNPANYIAPLPSIGTPPDFYNQSQLIEEDINTITGISDYMHGADSQNIRRTATEAAMIQDAANARARDKLGKVESFLAECGEAVVLLMQQFLTGEHVARITSVAGNAWLNYDADYLQGNYDFEVEGGSTEPRNESFRRQSALQLVDAMSPFVGAGVVNPAGLARYVLQYGFGIKDVSQIMVGPMEQQMGMGQQGVPGENGQPQGPPELPMGQPEAMPAGMAQSGGPPIEQMPMGGPQIPPELMAQMAGMNGGA